MKIFFKQKTRPGKNYEWIEKTIYKKFEPKSEKTVKSEITACEEKTNSEKANFCSNTVFSLYFKNRATKFYATKPLTFSLHLLFRRDQNHNSN